MTNLENKRSNKLKRIPDAQSSGAGCPHLLVLALTFLVSAVITGCGTSATPTPTPTKTPTLVPSATAEATPLPPPVPTDTLSPTATETSTAAPDPTEIPPPTATPLPASAATSESIAAPTIPPVAATNTPVPELANIAPPVRGGDWDMEDGFYVWPSPYENFGGFVANGWASFVVAYAPGADPSSAPRLNENKNEANVYSGQRSQEISFDYRSGEAGIYRLVSVTPGHRYLVEAWAKYAPSPSGLQLSLGVDVSGAEDASAATVQWYPWRDNAPDRWIATQETVRAAGDRLAIFLRSVHPVGEKGGNTMFDNVSLVDLGP